MKKIALILLIALACISFAACTGGDPAANADANELENYTPPSTEYKIDTGTLKFEDGPAESAVITGYSPNSEYATKVHTVEIPAEINERKVTAIGAEAFYYMTLVEGVVLPETVESIGNFAFAGCTNLKTVAFPTSLTKIGEYAFQGCTALGKVTFKGNALEEIDSFAFNECSALTTISLPEGLKIIGNQTFGNCAAIAEIKAPSTLEKIGTFAFYGCAGLNKEGALTLSVSITEIGEFAFEGINKLYIVAPEGSYAAEYVDDMFESEIEE